MELPASGSLDLDQIYLTAYYSGYTGPKALKELAEWSGWTSSNPNGTFPHDVAEFYGAITPNNITLGTHSHNGNGNIVIGEMKITNNSLDQYEFLSRQFFMEDDTNASYESYNDSRDFFLSPGETYIERDIRLWGSTNPNGFVRIDYLGFFYRSAPFTNSAKVVFTNVPASFDLISEGFEMNTFIGSGSAGGVSSKIFRIANNTIAFSSSNVLDAVFNMELIINA